MPRAAAADPTSASARASSTGTPIERRTSSAGPTRPRARSSRLRARATWPQAWTRRRRPRPTHLVVAEDIAGSRDRLEVARRLPGKHGSQHRGREGEANDKAAPVRFFVGAADEEADAAGEAMGGIACDLETGNYPRMHFVGEGGRDLFEQRIEIADVVVIVPRATPAACANSLTFACVVPARRICAPPLRKFGLDWRQCFHFEPLLTILNTCVQR